jgi:hypothetical protein
VSRFVSYADLPPILGVESPAGLDFAFWKRRLARKKEQYAPYFWVDFYADKFHQAVSVHELFEWGKLVGVIKFVFKRDRTSIAAQDLRAREISARTFLRCSYFAAEFPRPILRKMFFLKRRNI